jgi:hypothetical protein
VVVPPTSIPISILSIAFRYALKIKRYIGFVVFLEGYALYADVVLVGDCSVAEKGAKI